MNSLIQILAGNQLLLLFTVIGLGFLVGHVRIFGFRLGVSAVLFVGIAFGALDPRLGLPEHIYIIGLVLFVYAIGIQSGPGFFVSFQKRGLRANLTAVLVLTTVALLMALGARLFHLPAPLAAGVFCGALTNTPALAATVETVKNLSTQLPAQEAAQMATQPVVAYGLAYPFGVLGVILWFHLFSRLFCRQIAKEEQQRLIREQDASIRSQTFLVTNPALFHKPIGELLALIPDRRFSISRIKKGESVSVIAPATLLERGDRVVAVGTPEELQRAHILFGEVSAEHLQAEVGDILHRRFFVSSPEAVGKTVAELALESRFSATITRLQRGDVEFVPSPGTVLERGDRIRVVCRKESFPALGNFLGDSVQAIAETDFLSLSLGIVIGVFVGMIPLPLPGGVVFKLGFAGGPLIVALLLGRLERTGPITWSLPFTANLVLRQTGLVFFLAGIGTKAGAGLLATLRAGGLWLIIAGALVTSGVTVATILISLRKFHLPFAAVMGMTAGIHTQPACLAYASQQSPGELPNIWYATVYPAAMVTKILLAQLLVTFLF